MSLLCSPFKILSLSSGAPSSSSSSSQPAAPAAKVVQSLPLIDVLIKSVASETFCPEIMDLVAAYMAPTNDELRHDFLTLGRLSDQTMRLLDFTGKYIREVDLSGIPFDMKWPCRYSPFPLGLSDPYRTYNFASRCYSLADPQIFEDLFSRCRYIVTLNLAGCNINDACVKIMVRYLELQTVDLSGNTSLSLVAMEHIQGMAKTLQHLSLRNMRIMQLCLQTLTYSGTELSSCPDCRDPRFRVASVFQKRGEGVSFLNTLTALRTLDLRNNSMGCFDHRGWYLLASDGQNTELKYFQPDLIGMMQKITTLEKVIVNPVSYRGLREALQSNPLQAIVHQNNS